MNEEIDVSECRYYRKNKECDIWGIPCQMKEFCYFKILKQENAKLKETLEEIKEVFKKYDSEEEGTVAELLHDVFEVYGRVCEVLKDE